MFCYNKMEWDLATFLAKYITYYADYTTQAEGEYCDICFATAETLYDILKEDELAKDISTEKMHPYLYRGLLEDLVILGSFDSTSQSHAFVLIPFEGCIFVVQSLGGLYAAFVRVFSTKKLIKLTKLAREGETSELFEFQDTQAEEINVSYSIARRKSVTVDLLPPRRIEWLRDMRREYLSYLSPKYSMRSLEGPPPYFGTGNVEGVVLYRRPDARDALEYMEESTEE